jgi:hypothetical protein
MPQRWQHPIGRADRGRQNGARLVLATRAATEPPLQRRLAGAHRFDFHVRFNLVR